MFSTGQTIEGAVNYSNAAAVCGVTATGDNPIIANNQQNLSLPIVQACAAPISPKWVAAVTNWLCFAIDGGGLSYRSGATCQDPLLLLNAIKNLISQSVDPWPVMHAVDEPTVGSGIDNSVGRQGDYAFSHRTGNLYGKKDAGAYPVLPILWGNNRVLGVTANTTINRYNCFIEIGPSTGASTWTTTIPDPVGHANEELIIFNDSNVSQDILCTSGLVYGQPDFTTGVNPIVLVTGQLIVLRSDNANWIVVSETKPGSSGGGYSLVDCAGAAIASGASVATCAELAAAIGGGGGYSLKDCSGTTLASGASVVSCEEYNSSANNPYVTTGIGAAMFGDAITYSSAFAAAGNLHGTCNTGVVNWVGSGCSTYEMHTGAGLAAVGFDYRWPTTPPPGTWIVVGGASTTTGWTGIMMLRIL